MLMIGLAAILLSALVPKVQRGLALSETRRGLPAPMHLPGVAAREQEGVVLDPRINPAFEKKHLKSW